VPSILVVDRDPLIRERITLELRALGYDVAEAAAAPPPVDAAYAMPSDETVSAGGISVDPVGHWVIVNGDHVSLSPREFCLLLFLLGHRDRVFSREQLLARVWQQSDSVGLRTVDVHIRRLRSVLEAYRKDSYIQTVRGSGYRFSLKL
jgi:DNA-binding response OmpR family regulator